MIRCALMQCKGRPFVNSRGGWHDVPSAQAFRRSSTALTHTLWCSNSSVPTSKLRVHVPWPGNPYSSQSSARKCFLRSRWIRSHHPSPPQASTAPTSQDNSFSPTAFQDGSLSFVLPRDAWLSAAASAGFADSPLVFLARSVLPTAARQLALPPISNFHVAAAAIGQRSGHAYIGVNLEFPGLPLCHAVHAEQFAVALAEAHGEAGLAAMVITHPPCGHCRQFMQELRRANHLKLVIASTLDGAKAAGGAAGASAGPVGATGGALNGNGSVGQAPDRAAAINGATVSEQMGGTLAFSGAEQSTGKESEAEGTGHEGEWTGAGEDQQWLGHMLPHPFGPHDLLPQEFPLLLEARHNGLTLLPAEAAVQTDTLSGREQVQGQQEAEADAGLLAAALAAANRAYAPYSLAPSGVALRLASGAVAAGPYLESAAYNPSLPPLQAALVSLVAAHSQRVRQQAAREGRGLSEKEVLTRLAGEIVAAAVVEVEGASIRVEPTVEMSLREIAPHVRLQVGLARRLHATDGSGSA